MSNESLLPNYTPERIEAVRAILCEKVGLYMAAETKTGQASTAIDAADALVAYFDLINRMLALESKQAERHDAGLRALLKAQGEVIERWRGFIRQIFSRSFEGGGYDGGELQDLGEQYGLLQEVTITEACGENCGCAEVADFPTQCYRYEPSLGLKAAIGAEL